MSAREIVTQLPCNGNCLRLAASTGKQGGREGVLQGIARYYAVHWPTTPRQPMGADPPPSFHCRNLSTPNKPSNQKHQNVGHFYFLPRVSSRNSESVGFCYLVCACTTFFFFFSFSVSVSRAFIAALVKSRFQSLSEAFVQGFRAPPSGPSPRQNLKQKPRL